MCTILHKNSKIPTNSLYLPYLPYCLYLLARTNVLYLLALTILTLLFILSVLTRTYRTYSHVPYLQGVRSAVAECLGVLTSIHGESLVPILLELTKANDDKLTRYVRDEVYVRV